jgi:hypothetical protein
MPSTPTGVSLSDRNGTCHEATVRNWKPQQIYTSGATLGMPGAKVPNEFSITFNVRNVGRGPAILMRAWSQRVTESFTLGKTTVFRRPEQTESGTVEKLDLILRRDLRDWVEWFYLAVPWLFVIECSDSANGTHQLQILRVAGQDSRIAWKMAHAMGDSRGERVVRLVRRFVEVIQAEDKESEKLVP